MKTLLMSTVAAIFAAGTAYAADTVVIIDTDSDGVITMDEYQAALAEPRDDYWFDAWDADRDGMLTRDEINEGWFAQYDADQDEILSQDEVRAWNEDNIRLNAMKSGREISGGAPGGTESGGADAGVGGSGAEGGAGVGGAAGGAATGGAATQ